MEPARESMTEVLVRVCMALNKARKQWRKCQRMRRDLQGKKNLRVIERIGRNTTEASLNAWALNVNQSMTGMVVRAQL